MKAERLFNEGVQFMHFHDRGLLPSSGGYKRFDFLAERCDIFWADREVVQGMRKGLISRQRGQRTRDIVCIPAKFTMRTRVTNCLVPVSFPSAESISH